MKHLKETCQFKLKATRDGLEVIQGKWRIPIIISLEYGKKRFGEIQKDIVDISPKMLSQELKALEINKIIIRTVYDSSPVTVEYSLTPLGRSMKPLLQEVLNWGLHFRKELIEKKIQQMKNTTKKLISTILLSLVFTIGYAQKVKWENRTLELINTKHQLVKINGKSVLKLERDLIALPFDEKNLESSVDQPTFAKLFDTDIKDGIVEVKMMSKIMENSTFKEARGFIGIGFRIDNTNHFEGIYLRPANSRVEDQLRRNHTVQYFTYPGYSFSKLRKEAPGVYETYADIGLSEWIDVKIVFRDKKALLYINNQQHPSFIVNKLLGNTGSGSIGLWVDVGTVGYFKDLKVRSF